MYPAIPVSKERDARVPVRRTAAPATPHPKRDFFSRASHFAMVLIPVTVGVAYTLLKEYLAGPIPGGDTLYTGIMRNVLIQDGLAFRAFIYFMFLFGLGGALALLHAVGRVEDWEEKNLEK